MTPTETQTVLTMTPIDKSKPPIFYTQTVLTMGLGEYLIVQEPGDIGVIILQKENEAIVIDESMMDCIWRNLSSEPYTNNQNNDGQIPMELLFDDEGKQITLLNGDMSETPPSFK